MQINNATKYGFSRLSNLFRSGINYSHYEEIISSAVRPVVGNLPRDILNLIIKYNPKDKRNGILDTQTAFIDTCKILSERSKLMEQAAERINVDESNIVDLVLGLEKHTSEIYSDEIFKQENLNLLTKAQQTLFNQLKKILPKIQDVKLTFLNEGNYSNIFRCEIYGQEGEKLVSDKVLKCFHSSPDPLFNLDKKCYADLLMHSIDEIIEFNEKKGKKINHEDFKQASQNIINNVQTLSANNDVISQYTAKIHGAFAEANISEYIKYMSGHRLSYKEGIILPDMYVLSDTPFAISEFIHSGMKANKQFDFTRLGLYHSDLSKQNLINGICFDIGGIMPVVDRTKIKAIAQDRISKGKLSIQETFAYIEQARHSIIVGYKEAARFLKKAKTVFSNFQQPTNLQTLKFEGLFPERKNCIIKEINDKNLLA